MVRPTYYDGPFSRPHIASVYLFMNFSNVRFTGSVHFEVADAITQKNTELAHIPAINLYNFLWISPDNSILIDRKSNFVI